jgi:Glycine zipper 2TM domain
MKFSFILPPLPFTLAFERLQVDTKSPQRAVVSTVRILVIRSVVLDNTTRKTMKKLIAGSVALVGLTFAVLPAAQAAHGETALGAVIGGAVGALVGGDISGRDGAVVGAALGAATGAAVGHSIGRHYDRPIVVEQPYEPAPVYYAPPPRPVYYPAPVVYAPDPCPPQVVYLPRPAPPVVYVPTPPPVYYYPEHGRSHEWRDHHWNKQRVSY